MGGDAMALDKSQVTQMLRTMILIREFDERAIQLRVAGKIYGAVHPYVGQEAVAVGVCSNLTVSDRVTSTHRGHGHCIAKGADIRRMMAELFGRVDGYCKGKGGSMHIADFAVRSEEHTSELQSPCNLVCRLLLEKKKKYSHTLSDP